MPKIAHALVPLAALTLAGCGSQSAPAPAPSASPSAAPAVAAAPTPSAKPASRDPHELTCDWPVSGKDTAKTVLARFGKDARRATLGGPEGTELKGLVLWDGDPARRLEVVLDEESAGEHVAGVRPPPGSRWRAAGIGLGDPLERVVRVNGREFALWGLGWDYGGSVSDLKGGKLAQVPGGCNLTLQLDVRAETEIPEEVLGDRELQSDHAGLRKLGLVVVDLGLNWR